MRTKLSICVLIALFAVSCTKEQPAPVNPLVVLASVEQPNGGPKTSLDGLQVQWSTGDQIYLSDGTNSAIYQAETSAASTSFTFVSGSKDLTGDVYAYYPAASVTSFDGAENEFNVNIPSEQAYLANSFGNGAAPMTAKGTIVDNKLNLSFKNAFAIVKIQLTGTNSEKVTDLVIGSHNSLCGNATIKVDNSGSATTTVTGSKCVTLTNCDATLTSTATPFYVAIPAGAAGTIKITLFSVEGSTPVTRNKTTAKELAPIKNTIHYYNPADITSIPAITYVQPKSTCYMVDMGDNSEDVQMYIPLSQVYAGWDEIKAYGEVGIDVSAALEGTLSTQPRWIADASGTITTETKQIFTFDDDVLAVTFDKNCVNGSNVVVDFKSDDSIIWSWHFWFTNYVPANSLSGTTLNGKVIDYQTEAFKTGRYVGHVVMDRNLGATHLQTGDAVIVQPTTVEGAKALVGLMYQFGRKDPFENTGTSIRLPIADCLYPVTFTKSVQYPQNIIAPETRDWNSTMVSNPEAFNVWDNTKKSAFDPCPAGWRMPNAVYMLGYTTNDCPDYTPKLQDIPFSGGLPIKVNSSVVGWIPESGRYYNVANLWQSSGYFYFSSQENGYNWNSNTYVGANIYGTCIAFWSGIWRNKFSPDTKNLISVRCISE